MGKRGPKPQPTEIKVFRGNPGKRSLPAAEMKPRAGTPEMPEWLGEIGRAYWLDALTNLPPDVVTLADGAMLSQYAHAWEVFHEARQLVAEHGLIAVSDKGSEYMHPAVGIMSAARKEIRQCAALFGLSPSDRVGMSFGGEQPGDKFQEYLANRGGA